MPDAYRLRVAPNRTGVAQSRGGTAETEAAVKAALQMVGRPSGRRRTLGSANPRRRQGNVRGWAAIGRVPAARRHRLTGLALLAFLASGHTHLDGPYRDDVRRGLEYLLRIQAPDGNLGGQAATFEFMYCHAMAACA